MKLLYDLMPIVVFFGAYLWGGIYAATLATIGAYGLQCLFQWIRQRTVDRPLLIIFVSVVLLGGLTLILHNPIFIKLKPSIVYCIFAGIVLGMSLIKNKSAMQSMLGTHVTLPEKDWRKLDGYCTAFFMVQAILNLVVVYMFSTHTWVYYKLFGTLGMTLLFALGIAVFLYQHAGNSLKETP